MFTKNIFNQKSDAIVDLINKINEADYKVKMEALKGGQVKLDKNKNNKLDADDFKILRGEKKKVEEASPFDWKKPREPEVKGGSGVKAGRAYGGAAQKSKPEQNDADDKKKKVDEEIDPNDVTTDTLAGRVKGKSKNPFLQSKVRLDVPGNVKEEVEQVDEALRTVSTHGKGEGEHHAVVKRDPEWNEYQVHFYKGGKHMGEGPVSHHDDKADAQSTAETEVKRMNAKKNEEFNLEDIDPALVEEFMQSEEFEQLDELSKKTLKSYVGKAVDRVSDTQFRAGKHWEKGNKASADYESKETLKRMRGIHKATSRMAKEDVEQTDEAATMQPKGPARVDVPAYKRVNMKPLSLKDVVTKSTEKKSNQPNAVKEEAEQIDELSKKTLASYAKKASSSSHENSASNLASRAAYKLGSNDADDGAKDDEKSFRRSKGVGKAIDRLTKEEVELDEAKGSYELYHSQYSGAVHHGLAHHASKEGLSVHDDDYHQHVSMGPRKPAEGETVSHHIPAKDTKGNDHMIHMQVYNKGGDNKPYELNTYSSKVPKRHVKEESEQIDELSKETLKSYQDKAVKSSPGTRRGYQRIIGVARSAEKLKKEEVEQVDERELSSGETAEKERIVHGMKKGLSGFKARYGSRAKEVMYATATKKAKE